MITNRKIQDITLNNIKNGEVTLRELDEIYRKTGFIFVANQGKFTKIRKELKH